MGCACGNDCECDACGHKAKGESKSGESADTCKSCGVSCDCHVSDAKCSCGENCKCDSCGKRGEGDKECCACGIKCGCHSGGDNSAKCLCGEQCKCASCDQNKPSGGASSSTAAGSTCK